VGTQQNTTTLTLEQYTAFAINLLVALILCLYNFHHARLHIAGKSWVVALHVVRRPSLVEYDFALDPTV
jgi:hypothetical protein